jgi:hypothetical protein
MRLECETSFYNDEKLDGDLTHAQETADEAKELAEQAGGTATNYLYESVEKGLVVSRTKVATDTEVEALTTPNSRVTADGFDVYKDGETRVAHFGETTVLGSNGKPQQVIDNTSLKFTSGQGATKMIIENGIVGEGMNDQSSVKIPDGYVVNNAIDPSVLAQSAATTCKNVIVRSAPDEYAVSVNEIRLDARFRGNAWDSDYEHTDEYRSDDIGLPFGGVTLENGVLSVTISETEQSNWIAIATDFAAMFPTGTYAGFEVYVDFYLRYEIEDAQMTIGTRDEYGDIGAKSFTIGSHNTASGTGSVAIGKALIASDNYSVVVGESNNMESEKSGGRTPVAFAVGADYRTPFAVLKTGAVCMSSNNMGRVADQSYPANSKTDVTVTFKASFPFPPFVFLTLTENNVPSSAIADYGNIQIYLKSVTQDGFVATVVNGGSAAHSFSFNWLAFSII